MSKQQVDIKKARNYLDLHKNSLNRKYKVDGTAVGYKTKDGKYTDRVALIFYVKKKKSESELAAENITPVPKRINGIDTDVVVMAKGFRLRTV